MQVQLRAFSNDGEVWHSNIGYFIAGESINAIDYFPSSLPSEFEQMEQRVTVAKNETPSAQDVTITTAGEVESARQEVAENQGLEEQEVVENTDF